MKKISLFVLATLLFAGISFAQTAKTTEWPEMKAFSLIKDAAFTPAEKGNLAPLKAKVAEIYRTAKVWMGSTIPADFNTEKTSIAIKDLNVQCHDIWVQVEAKATDAKLKQMVKEANATFKKIATECRNK